MTEPLVSVIMPVYGAESFLDSALESLRGQTLKDIEVIAVDDGSPDRSGEILDSWARRWSALRVLHRDNAGAASARNVAIDMAKGRYVALQDADDISEPRRLEAQVARLEKRPELALVGTYARLIDTDGVHIGVLRLPTHPDALEELLRTATPFCHPSLMFRRSVFDAGHRYDARYANCHDYDLLTRIMAEFRGTNVDEPLYRLRLHGAQLSVRFLEAGGYRGLAARRLLNERRSPPFDLGSVTREQVLSLGISANDVDHHIVGRYRYWLRALGAGAHTDEIEQLSTNARSYLKKYQLQAALASALLTEIGVARFGRNPIAAVSDLRHAVRLDAKGAFSGASRIARSRAQRFVTDPRRKILGRLYAARNERKLGA